MLHQPHARFATPAPPRAASPRSCYRPRSAAGAVPVVPRFRGLLSLTKAQPTSSSPASAQHEANPALASPTQEPGGQPGDVPLTTSAVASTDLSPNSTHPVHPSDERQRNRTTTSRSGGAGMRRSCSPPEAPTPPNGRRCRNWFEPATNGSGRREISDDVAAAHQGATTSSQTRS